ncbi:MAG: hypothetical protein GY727_01875 [Gammaproteobacteria bacterium]|nr:hypothetical protein [Gammaproteobacteria bacterium]MCP4090954.1 hypothetical protein [Gammaproteobacteria bacterium]MCP4277663.1 hypothetical protein [Gammaproteobacteria bacterium]MCP4929980.1 hypothetical protein [Gammaproteobacteria bacterium]MCP4993636.1 hypothetical protein [Gammaproteobacteria bacterium]
MSSNSKDKFESNLQVVIGSYMVAVACFSWYAFQIHISLCLATIATGFFIAFLVSAVLNVMAWRAEEK